MSAAETFEALLARYRIIIPAEVRAQYGRMHPIALFVDGLLFGWRCYLGGVGSESFRASAYVRGTRLMTAKAFWKRVAG